MSRGVAQFPSTSSHTDVRESVSSQVHHSGQSAPLRKQQAAWLQCMTSVQSKGELTRGYNLVCRCRAWILIAPAHERFPARLVRLCVSGSCRRWRAVGGQLAAATPLRTPRARNPRQPRWQRGVPSAGNRRHRRFRRRREHEFREMGVSLYVCLVSVCLFLFSALYGLSVSTVVACSFNGWH